MITQLKENGRVKADQYWPTRVGKKLVMDNKVSVKFMSEVETDGKRTAPPAPPTSATKPARMQMKMHTYLMEFSLHKNSRREPR